MYDSDLTRINLGLPDASKFVRAHKLPEKSRIACCCCCYYVELIVQQVKYTAAVHRGN